MAEHTISPDKAGEDPVLCAAYIIEGITNAEAKSGATAALVGHFLSVGDVDSAAAFADGLDDPFARDRLLVGVIAKCIDLKDDEYAFQLIEAVEDSGVRAGAFEIAALRLSSRGEYEKALETAEQLEHSSDTVAGIAVTQAAKGDGEAAAETLSGIDYQKARVFAMIEIAAEYMRNEQAEKADEWLERASEHVGDIEFEEDRIRALNELGNIYVDTGKKELAADFFQKAAMEASNLDNIHRDGFLVAAAIGLLKAGNIEGADETLDIVEDKTQVAACLYGFSRVYEADEKEDAVETIEESLAMLKSQSEYEIRNTKDHNNMFGVVAVQFQRVGLTQRSVEIAHSNIDEVERNNALTGISQLLVMDGKETEADEVASGIEPESEKVAAFVGLSDAANTIGNQELAVEYLRKATGLLEEVEQMISRAETSDQISLRFEAYGKVEEAVKIARKNLERISEIKDEGGKAAALIALASVYKKLEIEPDENDKSLLLGMARKVDW